MNKNDVVVSLVNKMTVDQKIGQCLVIGYVGSVITPEILNRIRKYSPSGIRAGMTLRVKSVLHDPYAYNPDCLHRVLRHPKGPMKDYLPGIDPAYCTAEEYCGFLNRLKQEALDNGAGIPLHITMDMEGDQSCDFMRAGIFYMPTCLGQAAAGDPRIAYDCAWATGRQLHSIGVNWLHSPVLDTNTEPLNKEIGIRSYGGDSETVSMYAERALEGFRDAGIIATGKHFPGRGHSVQDAHHHLPVINLSRNELEEHLRPFKALVDAGIPCIMTAHTAYPALDPSGKAATLSKPILTDLLKGEYGFKGVVCSDDITMGGIVEKYDVADACIESINAGCDLILLRDESPLLDEVFDSLVKAVHSGRLPEERLNDAICRTLSVKYDYGLFKNGNLRPVSEAGVGIADPKVGQIARKAADQALTVLRDDQSLLPLSPESKILLIEQVVPLHLKTNTMKCHPGCFLERLLDYSQNICSVEVPEECAEKDFERIKSRLDEADLVIMTHYFDRRGTYEKRSIKMVSDSGKPLIVITNSPFPLVVKEYMKTVICTHGVTPECLDAAARVIFSPKA